MNEIMTRINDLIEIYENELAELKDVYGSYPARDADSIDDAYYIGKKFGEAEGILSTLRDLKERLNGQR